VVTLVNIGMKCKKFCHIVVLCFFKSLLSPDGNMKKPSYSTSTTYNGFETSIYVYIVKEMTLLFLQYIIFFKLLNTIVH
jgi:hypothetical protein